MCCNANDLSLLVGSFDYKICCFIYSVSFFLFLPFVLLLCFCLAIFRGSNVIGQINIIINKMLICNILLGMLCRRRLP